jgi:hypothetical protein
MKNRLYNLLLVLLLTGTFACSARCQEQKPLPTENFFAKSLHYTNRGIEYLYSKEQGGVERITGLSAAEVGCVKAGCHVTSCDACHLKEVNGKLSYSLEPARAQDVCLRCHPVEKDDPDVHIRKGMKCMDCHSLQEIHGDGVEYTSYQQPGALVTRCEKCHASIKKSMSHVVHGGKMACAACHVRNVQTCYNCHFETRIQGKNGSSIPLEGMIFLINHNGKVTTANFLSYVCGNRTMITFARTFPHSIMKEGRACRECHDTQITRDMKGKRFRLVEWKNGAISNVKGVIPVLDGMNWGLVFLGKENDQWMPLQKPDPALLNYSGYSSPITEEQFKKLAAKPGKP